MTSKITTNKEIRKYNLSSPAQIVRMAKIVKDYVNKNKLSVPITTKNKRTGEVTTRDYVMVEGWQFAGGLLGFSPEVVMVEDRTPDGTKNYKWFAEVIIVRNKDEKKVGRGFALCSKEEWKKQSFDEFAILSMAQTRAIGKAFRNKIGWVMKLAGYESTPAEEMKKGNEFVGEVKQEQNNAVGVMAGEDEKSKIKKLAKEIGLNTIKQIEKKIGITIDLENLTKVQARRVYAELLNLQIKK